MSNKNSSNPDEDGLNKITVHPQPQANRSNFVAQQSCQDEISMESWIPIGSQLEVRVPVPVKSTTVIQPSVPFTSPPTENFEAVVLAQDSIHYDQDEQEEDVDEEFGQAVGTMFYLLNDKNKELKRRSKVITELRANVEVVSIQLKESEEQIALLNEKIEKVAKKAENDVKKTKSEERIYRNTYEKLHEKLLAVESESVEKDEVLKEQEAKVLSLEMMMRKLEKKLEEKEKTIFSLKKQVEESETQINERDSTVLKLQTSAKTLNEQLKESEKKTALAEDKFKTKREQLLQKREELSNMRSKIKEMEGKINNLVEEDNANKITIQQLETEQINLNLSVKVMEETISEKDNEISKISLELGKVRNENKVKVSELGKERKRIKILKDEVKSLKKEIGEIETTTMNKIVEQVRGQFLQVKRRKRAVSCSSSSEGEEIYPESSSVAVANEDIQNSRRSTGNEVEQPAIPDDNQKESAIIGKRKHNGLQHPKFNTGATGGDVEIPEVNTSFRGDTSQ